MAAPVPMPQPGIVRINEEGMEENRGMPVPKPVGGSHERSIGFEGQEQGIEESHGMPVPKPVGGSHECRIGFEGQEEGMEENPGMSVPKPVGVCHECRIGFEGQEGGMEENPGMPVPTPVVGSHECRIGFEGQGSNNNSSSADCKTGVAKKGNDKRRIDFVLVYEAEKGKQKEREKQRHESKEDSKEDKSQQRLLFEDRLKEDGIHFVRVESPDGKTCYSLLNATWPALAMLAKYLRIKVPVKVSSSPTETDGDGEKQRMVDFCELKEDSSDKEELFTNAQKSYMVYELLLRVCYSDHDKQKRGIDRMIKDGIYTAAYPLHDSEYKCNHSTHSEQSKHLTDRQLLYEKWARPGRWRRYQPLDAIRNYFGEKIGIYFAWLGFYTAMLIPPSIFGLIVFLYGIATMYSYTPSEEICDENRAGNLTMCPLCDTDCDFWPLKTSCTYARLTYLFDNEATVAFACFMAIWATVFLELWKRMETVLRYEWGESTFKQEERLRPEYKARAVDQKTKVNPVTKEEEPLIPMWIKYSRLFTSGVVMLFMISLVITAVVAVILYEMIVAAVLYAADSGVVRQNAKLVTTATAAVINLIFITFLNKIYKHLAVFLTNMEQPRTNTEYNDSFTFKMFLFQFIDFYSAIFYVAFFKGRLGGRPGQYNYTLFGYRAEECDPAGCLTELCIQLGIIMVGDQLKNNVMELIVPMVLIWNKRRKSKKKTKENSIELNSKEKEKIAELERCEQDLALEVQPPLGMFDEYLEMVVQYGFVTIFVAAFPLAPLFALFNNIIEIRVDAYKFLTLRRRPVAFRAESIGIWFGILRSVSIFAVLTNAFIIAWTSDFVPKLVYKLTVSPDMSLTGYVNHSLSYFNVSDFQNDSKTNIDFNDVEYCRYSDYRNPPDSESKYEFTEYYWQVLVARLAFVIVFEHFVFLLTRLVTVFVPDVPSSVRVLMFRDVHLEKEARFTDAQEAMKKNN